MHLDAAVEPVPEALAAVYILVGEVYAAGEGGDAVYDAYLAVVAVVERTCRHGLEAVEGAAAYAHRLHALRVVARQAHDAR